MNLLSLQNDSATDVLRPADGIEFTDTEHLNMLFKNCLYGFERVLKEPFLVIDLCLLSHFIPQNCDVYCYWQSHVLRILKTRSVSIKFL